MEVSSYSAGPLQPFALEPSPAVPLALALAGNAAFSLRPSALAPAVFASLFAAGAGWPKENYAEAHTMHIVHQLKQALELAQELGYEIRQDWLDGNGGGHCLVRGRKLLMIDLAQSHEEQFAIVRAALRGEPQLARIEIADELADALDVRSAA